MAKAETLAADAIIFDLEDAVAPRSKAEAREAVRTHFNSNPESMAFRVIRINGFDTPWGTEDFLAARACSPDAILVPKVANASIINILRDALAETDAPPSLQIWAMIETAAGVLNAAALPVRSRDERWPLSCLVVGTNDLFKDTGLIGKNPRVVAHPWLMQVVLAAKANGVAVLDGVFNDFRDVDRFGSECEQSVAMGFDGKTLIHPNQVQTANAAFAPSPEAIREANEVVLAFAEPENADKGVISLAGKMVERLHLAQAEALLAKVRVIAAREEKVNRP